jgi:hypothetical protein
MVLVTDLTPVEKRKKGNAPVIERVRSCHG